MIDKPQARKLGMGALAVLAVGGAAMLAWSMRGESAASIARTRTFICAETGKPFTVQLTEGGTTPKRSPHSERDTGYPAELCFWTADGKPKNEPTFVLLNHWVGKPGPTFCPDCARLVVGHNPRASADAKPPPTRDQYRADATPERF